MAKKFEIRNSTAEFLIFTVADKEQGVEVLYKDESIWATQKVIATLFDVDRTVVTKHLKNIFDTCELDKEVVCAKIAHTTEHGAIDGKTQTKEVQYYNLDAIISVGYRVNSIRATQFRQWCTYVLRQFAIRGYVIDKKRMENGSFIGEDYFEHLLAEVREIRLSERRFYQNSPIFTPLPLTTIAMRPLHGCSSKRFRTKCTMPYMGIRLPNLSCNVQTPRKNTWGLPLGKMLLTER